MKSGKALGKAVKSRFYLPVMTLRYRPRFELRTTVVVTDALVNWDVWTTFLLSQTKCCQQKLYWRHLGSPPSKTVINVWIVNYKPLLTIWDKSLLPGRKCINERSGESNFNRFSVLTELFVNAYTWSFGQDSWSAGLRKYCTLMFIFLKLNMNTFYF